VPRVCVRRFLVKIGIDIRLTVAYMEKHRDIMVEREIASYGEKAGGAGWWGG